jgi:hypothetical protein
MRLTSVVTRVSYAHASDEMSGRTGERGKGSGDVKSDDLAEVRRTLWKAADELQANSTLTPAD